MPELDPLTELYDRRRFTHFSTVSSSALGAGSLCRCSCSTSTGLTTINARIGHLAADEILVQIAALLRDVAGQDDLPCRIGGGRFGALFPGDTREAERLFERLQATLREEPFAEVGL